MLWTIAIIFLLLWALGLATSYTLGGYLHVLVGLATMLLLIRIMKRGNRSVVASKPPATTVNTGP